MKNTNEMNENKKQPRGLRNNNPLNIRRTRTEWIGEVPILNGRQDPEFCQFRSQSYGWRAAFVLLTSTYYRRYHLYTIEKIIRRWAPPCENRTRLYIARVSAQMRYPWDEPLGLPTDVPSRWMQLALAMAVVENGTGEGIDTVAMLDGWRMARQSVN